VSRRCTVCVHPDSLEINELLVVAGRSKRTVADQFGLSATAVQRHKEHIPELLIEAARNTKAFEVDSILMRVEDLERETLTQLEGAKEDIEDGEGDRKVILAAIREQRSNIELVAKIRQIIDSATTVNIAMHPEFVEVQNIVVTALDHYPDAKRAVVDALRSKVAIDQ
jgi:hypothetical protein